MDGAGAERAAELLEQALKLTSEERREFLEAVRAEDVALAAELDSLLAAYDEAPNGLHVLAARVLPSIIDGLSRAVAVRAPMGQRTVGRYALLEPIGRGAMGEVYRARDLELDRLVALKFLAPGLTGDPEARARLKSEARAASALDHPNIAVVHEIGAAEPVPGDPGSDRLFIAMAYYPGETIREKIARGPIPVPEALAYAIQVAAGLARAHEAGIVHRDIKPANVIVTDRGEVKVLDFGVAKLAGADVTKGKATLGTVAYMSPEQTRGEAVDHRTDVWSLGVMVYEMLAATRPFAGADDTVTIHAIRHDEPEPLERLMPEVPAELARAVGTCLAKDPGARYQQTAGLLAALRAIEGGETPEDRPAPRRASVGRWAAVAVGVIAGATAAGAALIGPDRFARLIGRAVDPLAIEAHGAPRIAVLPFAPAATDSSLERLGRDLVVTLTAGLDGLGDLRTVDSFTALALVEPRRALPLDAAHGAAQRLAAEHFIHGALTRAGAGLRLHASLYEVGSAEPIARATVTAGDLAALTDRAIIGLLDALWRREPPRVPSLAAVTRSAVPAARRAYLEGELALVRSEMGLAVEAFERAFAADTTFWWAYWRSLLPRGYRETEPADLAVLQKVIDHRWELPEPDRRLIEATRLSRSLSEQLSQLRLLTGQFPNYEPAWWEYANRLVHTGGYLGYTPEDARSALERVLELNPRLTTAWDHLQWIALVQGDSSTAARAGQEAAQLVGVAAGPSARHIRAELVGSGLIDAERLDELVDHVLSAPPGYAEALASGLVADGFPAKQIQLNRAVRERAPSPALSIALWRGEALAWAARGAWDSAMVAADQWVRASAGADAQAKLGAYRLAVAGVLLNAIPATEAIGRRPAAARAISRWSTGLETDCNTPAAYSDSAFRASGRPETRLRCELQVREAVYQQSELTWLDGVLAYLAGEPDGIALARRALYSDSSASGLVARPIVSPWDSVSRPILGRSLAALALDAEGDPERAAREMVAVETEIANRLAVNQVGGFHPLLPIANRLVAARWLRSIGEDVDAARLLNWHEAVPGDALIQAWNRAIGSISLLDRAEIAESAGYVDRARRDYTRFLEWYDLADPDLQPLVERAMASTERLATELRR